MTSLWSRCDITHRPLISYLVLDSGQVYDAWLERPADRCPETGVDLMFVASSSLTVTWTQSRETFKIVPTGPVTIIQRLLFP